MIMDYVEIRPPRLVESGVKYFLNETLKQCHIFKERFHNWIFNIGLFLLFLIILGCKQQYILSKVQKFQLAKKQAHQELITGLPNWESEFETFSKKLIY